MQKRLWWSRMRPLKPSLMNSEFTFAPPLLAAAHGTLPAITRAGPLVTAPASGGLCRAITQPCGLDNAAVALRTNSPPRSSMAKRPIYCLRLRALPGVDAVRALRAALKRLLRSYGLKCLSVEREHDEGTQGNAGAARTEEDTQG